MSIAEMELSALTFVPVLNYRDKREEEWPAADCQHIKLFLSIGLFWLWCQQTELVVQPTNIGPQAHLKLLGE